MDLFRGEESTRINTGWSIGDERSKIVPCPICGSAQYLRIVQSFGAYVFCSRCGITSDFVSGNDFYRERSAGISQWNREMKNEHAKEKAQQLLTP